MSLIVTILQLFLWISFVISDNATSNYMKMMPNDFKSKDNRLLTFNTQDEGDIEIDLEFKVPFLTFPIKKSIDMASGAVANINLGSIILAGIVIVSLVIVLPGALLLLSKKTAYPMKNSEYRMEDSLPYEWWKILAILDRTLGENHLDTMSCLQRMICWNVKNSAKNVNSGHCSSNDKIIDGLATSKWLLQFLDGTTISKAIQDGLNNQHCSKEYSNCKITQKSFQIFAKHFVNTINHGK